MIDRKSNSSATKSDIYRMTGKESNNVQQGQY